MTQFFTQSDVEPIVLGDITGEILYDGNGIWYWSPTGEPGTWHYPLGSDPVFVSDAEVAAHIDEQALEDEAATQAYLRTVGMGSWMSRQPVRFPTTRVDAPVYA